MVDVGGDCSADCSATLPHVTAFAPAYIACRLSGGGHCKEREIARRGHLQPAAIGDNINGKISKWYGEVCLTKQP